MTTRIAGLSAALVAVALTAAPAQAKTVSANCRGDDNRCTAALNLNGGQSGTIVRINLAGTDMELRAVHVLPRSDAGAFDLSHEHFRLGGSQYVARLSAANGIGRFRLHFLFKSP
jgi:hypothetical protein